jgi:hypothetical protein
MGSMSAAEMRSCPLHFPLAHGRARHIQNGGVLAQNRIQHFHFGIAVDTLVHPGIFEFVGCHHAVPVLVPELMLDHQLRQVAVHPA